ncbi:MAG: hypothetical protein HOC23_22020 [Halieaceae bacterium]|nr:hypothetical protein [Halieaceae bacterium]
MLEDQLLNPSTDGVVVGSILLDKPAGDVESNKSNANRNDVQPEELSDAYREYLTSSLVKYGIAHEPGKKKYVTNITILGYKEGSAFIRWLTPAGGESKIVVQATLELGDVVIGGVESQQSIAWGGGFSIAGWRHVIRWSAQEVGQKLCQKMFRDNVSELGC